MGRSSHRHGGTKHTGTAFVHKRHHHENKKDIAETRALEAVRRDSVAVIDAPLPDIKPLLSSDAVSQAIRDVIGDGFEDTFQDVWVEVLERGLNDIEAIKSVAKEISHKHASEVVGDKYKTVDLDTPIGKHKDESDDFTLESILPAQPERGVLEIEQDIDDDAPKKRAFGKYSRKGVVWLDAEALDGIRARYPHEALLPAIKHLLSIPVNEQTPYSLWEDAIIRDRYTWGGSQAVQLSLNRSTESINVRAQYLGVRLDGKPRPVKEWLDIPHLAAALGVEVHVARALILRKEISYVRIPKYFGNRDGVFVTPEALADYKAGKVTPEVNYRKQLAEVVQTAKNEVRAEMREKHRISIERNRAMLQANTVSRRAYKARTLRNLRKEFQLLKDNLTKERRIALDELKATKRAELKATKESLIQEKRAAIAELKATKEAELKKLIEERQQAMAEIKERFIREKRVVIESIKAELHKKMDASLSQYEEQLTANSNRIIGGLSEDQQHLIRLLAFTRRCKWVVDYNEARQLYESGLSVNKVAQQFNIPSAVMWHGLKRAGCRMRLKMRTMNGTFTTVADEITATDGRLDNPLPKQKRADAGLPYKVAFGFKSPKAIWLPPYTPDSMTHFVKQTERGEWVNLCSPNRSFICEFAAKELGNKPRFVIGLPRCKKCRSMLKAGHLKPNPVEPV